MIARLLDNLRLRTKLSLVVIASTLMASLLLFAAVTVLEYHDSRHRVEERARGLARVLAQNVRAPLSFEDPAAAQRVLEGLGAVPEVRWAALLDVHAAVFAAFAQKGASVPASVEIGRLTAETPAYALFHALVCVVELVRVDGAVVGQLVVCTDASPAFSATLARAVLVLLGAAVIGLLASAVAVKVQDGMVQPIADLADVMHDVSRTHSYTTRVSMQRSDEVGALYEGFNRLLGELEARETVLQRQQARLFTLAHIDAVTGLSNRHHFRLMLDEALARVSGHPFAILCLDLDRFKTVNDALGHDVGDMLLTVVGQRLTAVSREGDMVARLGGDEFAMVLRDVADRQEVQRIADRVLAALCTSVDVEGWTVSMGVSIGIALAPRDGDQPDQLLKNADLALYGAKAGGRGRACFYDAGMSEGVVRRLQLERALRSAITLDQLSVVYQPQVDLASSAITGFEALVRWRHPELGDVRPDEFIAVAEEAGLINEIGAWVLEQACLEASTWPEHLSVAVNLSAVQVMTQDLPLLVGRVLATSGLAAARLEVEITESVLLNETEATLAQLHGLNRLGVRIALDDFGTGYSSMAYLRRFPFDKLKIDRCFVKALATEPDARVIVHAIIDMATGLHMKTLAEGVEREAELSALREEGCAEVQGYLVSRPLRVEAVLPFVREWTTAHPPAGSQAAAAESGQAVALLG
ncbi:putative bifunctional diguanylate cyclase/phosphodiesterase [Sphaerotilus sp.]|uniref:putative bifunctional diguanylate cyclase/phosphodiesterase n=1 Tax=Sphaerotilus sp. TaxID=2093942 RepID=UPI002ACEF165|nr:EAL domain-containing protein [Sphaerotilus sp.]MDZ7856041.1 EAL domain-containing protein [Sphaerotilus sp.]